MQTSFGKKPVFKDGVQVGEIEGTGTLEGDAVASHELFESLGLNKKTPLWIAMHGHARSFAIVAQSLHTKIVESRMSDTNSVHPFVVNATFGIEVMLKSLATRHGKTLRGHELLKLYDALPRVAMDELQMFVAPCAAKRELHATADVRQFLDELNNAFIQWRYSYESDTAIAVNLERIIFLIELLDEAGRAAILKTKRSASAQESPAR